MKRSLIVVALAAVLCGCGPTPKELDYNHLENEITELQTDRDVQASKIIELAQAGQILASNFNLLSNVLISSSSAITKK